MHITAGLLITLYHQFGSQGFAQIDAWAASATKESTQVDADLLGAYIEHLVWQHNQPQLGLEAGFYLPLSVMGVIYKLYQNCHTLGQVFCKSASYSPLVNTVMHYSTKAVGNQFVHEFSIHPDFATNYPVATRQLYEAQIGLSLQLFSTLTNRRIVPIAIRSVYESCGQHQGLHTFVHCPVVYGAQQMALVFERCMLDYPILTANSDLLPLVEQLIGEIGTTQPPCCAAVKRCIVENISVCGFGIDWVAWQVGKSVRKLQRDLEAEGTSFRLLLQEVRIDLAKSLVAQNQPNTEIAFLLGFETASAFNKFFQKHFGASPSRYRKAKAGATLAKPL